MINWLIDWPGYWCLVVGITSAILLEAQTIFSLLHTFTPFHCSIPSNFHTFTISLFHSGLVLPQSLYKKLQRLRSNLPKFFLDCKFTVNIFFIIYLFESSIHFIDFSFLVFFFFQGHAFFLIDQCLLSEDVFFSFSLSLLSLCFICVFLQRCFSVTRFIQLSDNCW